MKKSIYMAVAVMAAFSSCKDDSNIIIDTPIIDNESPTVFTATMEGAPETRATYNGELKCASWEVGDQVNIDGSIYEAQSSGTTTIFKKSTTPSSTEIRPSFVSSNSQGFSNDEMPSKLVDDSGVDTKWCANTSHRSSDVWDIVVSTGSAAKLQAIKLWNGNDTEDSPERRWKKVRVSGASSQNGSYETIKTFEDLNLASDNYGLAGTLDVNATQEYSFYKVEILDVMSGDIMQMSDMKFVVVQQSIENHIAYFPATLYNGATGTLPAEVSETWADGKFNMPMYATSTTTDLQFKNLCGVLKITVKSDQITSVKKIKVSSATRAVSGTFTINANNAAVLSDASTVANTLTITYTEAVPTTAEGKVFYVAVPAQTYQELKIRLDADGNGLTKSMTTKSATDITIERNKIYPITFADNAPPTTGTAKATIGGSEVDVNWVQLWENGPKFAEYNVGVTDGKAESYGGYYAWGGSQDKVDDHNTGTVDLTGDADTATKLWGSAWRMPTQAELEALLANCDVEWTAVNGVNGRKFTGKGDYASNFVFLPAAGYCSGGHVHLQVSHGDYWSSTPEGSDRAYDLYFFSVDQYVGSPDRLFGYSVRAVLAE